MLIERFDRHKNDRGDWCRKAMVSSLTIFALPEHEAHYASYESLAEKIRHLFSQPRDTLHELYRRMVFNVLVGNTDDQARNHAAFWNGNQLALTPAYDICPQGRTGQEASQPWVSTVTVDSANSATAWQPEMPFKCRKTMQKRLFAIR